LRQHIEKEDHCLFAMADQAFSAGEQAELLDRFSQAERQGIGGAAKEKLLESARGLAERCQVDSAAVTAVACGSPT
jgi:hemerythrin-like domain-containing protein